MKQLKLSLILFLLLAALLTGCSGNDTSYFSALNINWDLSFPEKGGFIEIYAKDSGASFLGDGIRYHAFSCSDSGQVENLLPWLPQPTTQATNFYPTLQEAADAWLNELQIPKEERPTPESCQIWYAARPDRSELLVFWDSKLQRIYIVENFL